MEQANFGKLLDESLSTLDFQIGTIITGVIVDLKPDWVTVHVGLKSEPVLARSEFLADESDKELEIGDEVKVTLEAVEDGYGETRVSRLRAMHDESWLNLEESLKTTMFEVKVITGNSPRLQRRIKNEICKKHNPKTILRETNDEIPNLGFSLSNKKILNT